MRAAFVQALVELADRDPRILLLTGDLGYMALEPFAQRHPGRFFNVGVAEQNMVGLATGLAEAGFVPWVYSIATFASLRPYEVIRNGPLLQGLPIRIVGMGGGFEYSTNGVTHFGLEDVGVMRLQPGLSVFAPADHLQTRTVLLKTAGRPGTADYRWGKDDRFAVPGLDGRFEPGEVQVVREGADVLLLSMGSVAGETEAAARELGREGISAAFGVAADLGPGVVDSLDRLLARFPVVVTVEAHYVNGGLGSLVAETIAERRRDCRLERCAVRRIPAEVMGSVAHLHELFGLSASAVAGAARAALRRSS